MASFKLKQWVIELQHISSREVFNVIDDLFIKMLMKARSAIEGPMKTFPYSQKKLEVSNTHLYWKLKVKHI